MSTATLTPTTTLPDRARLIVHNLEHMLAALTAAKRLGVTPTLQTPPDAIHYLGAGYLSTMCSMAANQHPDTPFHYVMDCSDAAGYALAALRAGQRWVLFRGDSVVEAKLKSIAEQHNAALLPPARETLDLWQQAHPLQGAMEFLSIQRLAKMKDLD